MNRESMHKLVTALAAYNCISGVTFKKPLLSL